MLKNLSRNKKRLLLFIGFCLLVLMVNSFEEEPEQKNQEPPAAIQAVEQTQTAEEKAAEEERVKKEREEAERLIAEQAEKERQEHITNAIVVGYDDLFRNNEEYQGKYIKYQGEIVQSVLNGKAMTFRINVTQKGDYFTYYEDTVYVDFITDETFLEDDIVEFVGSVVGIMNYTGVLGNKIQVPWVNAIDMKVITKAGDRN